MARGTLLLLAPVLALLPCVAAAAAVPLRARARQQPQPHGLLADFQSGLALGVSETPSFAWIVPACSRALALSPGLFGGQRQTAYQIEVSEEVAGFPSPTYRPVWESGRVASSESANVAYGGSTLAAGAAYVWTVTTWSTAASDSASLSATPSCRSAPSERSRFVTALFGGFAKGAAWVWPAEAWDSRFVFMRRVVNVDDTSAAGGGTCAAGARAESSARAGGGGGAVARALLFVAATVDEAILSAFKVYVGGTLVAIGPGRGEAEVRGGAGHGTFARQPYVTLDVTSHLQGRQGGVVLAVEAQSPMNDTTIDPWDPYGRHAAAAPAGVLLQLAITKADGTRCTVVTESASRQWTGSSADAYYNPLHNGGTW